jgi:hypothetical protein
VLPHRRGGGGGQSRSLRRNSMGRIKASPRRNVAIAEIKKYQRSTHLLIQKLPFARYVRHVVFRCRVRMWPRSTQATLPPYSGWSKRSPSPSFPTARCDFKHRRSRLSTRYVLPHMRDTHRAVQAPLYPPPHTNMTHPKPMATGIRGLSRSLVRGRQPLLNPRQTGHGVRQRHSSECLRSIANTRHSFTNSWHDGFEGRRTVSADHMA